MDVLTIGAIVYAFLAGGFVITAEACKNRKCCFRERCV